MQHLIAGAAGLVVGLAAQASVMSDWNLIVRNNLTSTSEVDGSALIGGNLAGTSNYATHSVTAPSNTGLAVGGNIAAGHNIQVNNGGHLRITGSALSTVNLNGGGSNIADPGVPALVSSVFSQLEAASAFLATLPSNGTMNGSGHFSAVPTLISGQLVAVYNISQNDFQSFGQISLTMGSAQSVIINVAANGAGVVDFTAPPNILSDFTQANSSRILWNFHNATSLIVNNSFNGAALAPYANLQLLGGGMNGTVVVNNVSVMNAEVRANTYTGLIPAPGATALFGLAALGAVRRRRAA